jgi:anti-anti-sigma factor
MATPLTLAIDRREGSGHVLSAAGELDMSNIEQFVRALDDGLGGARPGRLVVDLSEVEYLDSGAINALAARADQITVVANPLLMAALTISGLTELVDIEMAPEQR